MLVSGPSGANIDEHSGLLIFRPSAADVSDQTFEVLVQDLAGEQASQTFVLNIADDYILPRFDSYPATEHAVVNQDFIYPPDPPTR